MRSGPSITASRPAYSRRARRANSIGVNGISMAAGILPPRWRMEQAQPFGKIVLKIQRKQGGPAGHTVEARPQVAREGAARRHRRVLWQNRGAWYPRLRFPVPSRWTAL